MKGCLLPGGGPSAAAGLWSSSSSGSRQVLQVNSEGILDRLHFYSTLIKMVGTGALLLHFVAGDDPCNVFCAEIQLWLSSNKLTERDWVTRWMACMDSYWPK